MRSQGKDVWVLVPPPLPPMYAFLPGFEDIQAEPPHGIDPQLVFFFDSGNLERSGSGVRRIASHATLVNIDHHPSNSRFGDINIIDADAAAVGQMVMEMLDHFGYPITRTIATNLYVALLTDTGGFRHENTTPRALDDAARLARLGADPGHIATQVYKMRPETTLKLNEVSSDLTKISVRSRGAVDAAALCASFGGGGHIRAAGAEIERSMEEAMRIVLAAAKEAILAASSQH